MEETEKDNKPHITHAHNWWICKDKGHNIGWSCVSAEHAYERWKADKEWSNRHNTFIEYLTKEKSSNVEA